MNKNLVEWDISFSDHWDEQGHYTHSEGEYPLVWVMALNTMDAIIASAECLSDELDGEDEGVQLAACLFLTCLADHAETMGVDFDDVFDNTHEFDAYLESMANITYSVIERDWNGCRIHESLITTLPGFFGE
jgi:hypothetical protein